MKNGLNGRGRCALFVGLFVVSACGQAKTSHPDAARDATSGVDAAFDAAGVKDSAPADVTSDAPTEAGVDAAPDSNFDRLPFDGDPTTPLGACGLYSRAVAAYYSRCLGYLADPVIRSSDAFFCPAVAASVAAGHVAFDASQVSTCVDAIDGLACLGDAPASDPPCAAFTPLVQPGSACNPLASECAGGAVCWIALPSCAGVCVTPLVENATCTMFAPPCGTGLTCQNGQCAPAPQAAADQACEMPPTFVPCAPGLYCASANTCQPQKTTGPCTTISECALPSRCLGPAGAKQCILSKTLGTACTPGLGECQIEAWCSPVGVCVDDPIPIGGSCVSATGDQGSCGLDAYCNRLTERCAALQKVGDLCAYGNSSCGGDNYAGVCGLSDRCAACPL